MENRIGQAAPSRYDSTQATEPLPPVAAAALKRLEDAFNPTLSQADEFLRQARTEQTVIARFPAGHPRGSRPAEDYARQLTESGRPATVVMDLANDRYLVKAVTI
ncbi:hypothetical protein ACWGOK_40430 [Streptomyces eurythermus]